MEDTMESLFYDQARRQIFGITYKSGDFEIF